MTRFRLMLGLAAAMVATMLVGAAPAAAQQNKPFYGVANQGGLQVLNAQDFDRMQAGRIGTLRFLVNVDSLRRGDGSINWSLIDNALRAAAARGVRGLPYIFQERGPRNRAQRRALARFAGQMVARYGPGGTFWQDPPPGPRRPIVTWQILNEQNARAHWGRRPQPRAYGQVLKMVARAIRRQHKGAEIVVGGMFGNPRGKGSMPSWRYLNRLYRVKRIKRFFNTVGVHPYAPSLRGVRRQVQRVRGVMRRNGHRRAGIRVTEIGWGSARTRHPQTKGPKGQARMLRQSFRLFTRHRNRRKGWNIRGLNWWAWRDWNPPPGTRICAWCFTAGLFTENRQPKRSWRAFRQASRR